MPDVFQLLSDPTRRHLLEALRNGERSVNDLVERTRMSQPAVSKQLRLLKDSRMVALRRDGRKHLYSIRGEPFREASEWLGFYERFWRRSLARMDEILGTDTPRRKRGKA
ncbi:MAG: metalloregulator ArsR/SmtB family transcription factor [Thermoplasmata archaeon]|nr:metalloregulator ArsR/SmtB family transcription factor [Thermoplasmata archaeon]MCI4340765.1 metalloregulator ArsR/SmtB family transcription factor [Thermoplasmata archaeon]